MGQTANSRITLRQLCNLNLPAPVILPSLLPAIRDVIPAAHAAFFYVDDDGNVVNMYAERMLPPHAMTAYYEKYYRADASAFAKTWSRLVAATDPVSSRTLSEAELATEYYRDVLSLLEVGHIMYAVVRAPNHTQEPIGQLSLYRAPGEKPFGAGDARAMRDALRHLGGALAAATFTAVTPPAAQVAEESMAVLDDEGNTLFADETWTRLVRLARGEPISPQRAAREQKALREFLQGVVKATAASKNALHMVSSPWGRFAFRHHTLAAGTGQRATALVLSRFTAEAVQMTEGAGRLKLSAQQRQVALMVALGMTNAEIGAKLGVSVNTAGYHVKQVFVKLGVHDRSEVAPLLRQS